MSEIPEPGFGFVGTIRQRLTLAFWVKKVSDNEMEHMFQVFGRDTQIIETRSHSTAYNSAQFTRIRRNRNPHGLRFSTWDTREWRS